MRTLLIGGGCAVASLLVVVISATGCSKSVEVLSNSGGDSLSSGNAAGGPDAPAQARGGAAAVSCPSGLGSRWVCDGSKRQRCIDGFVQSEACSSGCNDPAGSVTDAVCVCPKPGFTRWNCTADGDLHSCGGGGWMSASCGGKGCTAAPSGTSDSCNVPALSLQATVDKLGPQCGQFSPGTVCSISVQDLTTGEAAHYRSNVFYAPASTVKALWVAAALSDVGIEKVKPFAEAIFVHSDNSASGKVIDLLVSPDRVNTFTWHDVGLPDIGFCRWNYDKERMAANCDRKPRGGNNFMTSSDGVRFLSAVWSKRLLGVEKTKQLLDWMKWSPRQGYGGWLGTQLPEEARAAMHHKAGWLPPTESPTNSNANEIGIVPVPNGHAYAVTLLLDGAPSQESYDRLQLPTLEYASCVVYHAVAKDQADPFGACVHP